MKVKYKTGRWVVRMAMWLPLIVLSVVAPLSARAQADELAKLRDEIPKLTERYGNRLESRTAHYIFAIDISNSMRKYEKTVRNSLISFVNAVPDGDQISIIVMTDKRNTDYLDNIQCVTISTDVRRAIVDALRSPRFTFTTVGSDGYKMTELVLKAMNTVGSSELTFVYLLTDFYYWTREYGYNKNAEDWNALSEQLSDKHRGLLCKYGVELTSGSSEPASAIFKPELDKLFGPLEYHSASSATLLSQWFGHIIDNIRANKINAMLKADWTELADNRSMRMKTSGGAVTLKVNMPKNDLVTGYQGCAAPVENFDALPLFEGELGKSTKLGSWQQHRHWWPCITRVGGDSLKVNLTYDSPYGGEIARLQELCSGAGAERLNLTEQYTLENPAVWVWNSTLPIPVWAVIILLLLAAAASVVYTLTRKYDKRLSFTVYLPGGQLPCSGDTRRYPYTIGDACTLDVHGATWKTRVETSKGIWLAFGLKGGYYLTLLAGSRATLYNNRNDKVQATLRRGQKTLLFGRNNKKPLRLEIDEDGMGNITTIEIN